MTRAFPSDSPAPKTERLAKRLAGALLITLALLFAAVAVIIAQHASAESARSASLARQASAQAARTADCINSILAARAPLTDADHANERQKIADQTRAVHDEAAGLSRLATSKVQAERLAGFRLYQQGVSEFVQSLADWTTRDGRIAAAKAEHPLGRC